MTNVDKLLTDALSPDLNHDQIIKRALRIHFDTDSFDDPTVLDIDDETIEALKSKTEKEEIDQRLDWLHNGISQRVNRHQDMNNWFFEKSIRVWKEPFRLLEEFIILSLELGQMLNDELRPHAVAENRFTFDALIRLQWKACLIAQEVLVLMKHGFPDGANARWRSLYEISIVSWFIVNNGNRTAEQFLAYDAIQTYKDADKYQKYADRLGYPKEPQEFMDKLEKKKDEFCERYGKPFGEDNGWAAEALGVTEKRHRIYFTDIEKAVELDHMRPYYRLASHSIHADPKSISFSLGQDKENYILNGPTEMGMADPGQNSVISLLNVNLSLLKDIHPNRPSRMIDLMLRRILEETLNEFIEVHRRLEQGTEG